VSLQIENIKSEESQNRYAGKSAQHNDSEFFQLLQTGML
jgi:hypothetical protein